MWNDSDDQYSIENNKNAIASALGIPTKKFLKIFAEIEPIFEHKDGRYISKRLRKERKKQKETAAKRSQAAAKRWSKDAMQMHCKRNANALQKECSSSSTSSSTSVNKNTKVFFVEDSEPYKLAAYLRARILENLPTAKVPQPTSHSMQRWSEDVDKMIRLDNREPQDIQHVIEFAATDSFWKANILSAKKLRDKYDQLYLKMNQGNGLSERQPKGYSAIKEFLNE